MILRHTLCKLHLLAFAVQNKAELPCHISVRKEDRRPFTPSKYLQAILTDTDLEPETATVKTERGREKKGSYKCPKRNHSWSRQRISDLQHSLLNL